MVSIITDLISEGKVNRPAIANPCRYITIHNTGNYREGAGAAAQASYLKTVNDTVSWHYSVDDKSIYQHLPDDETAYHAGDGSGDGNRKSIGIEICVNPDSNLLAATDRAARLVARLCKKYDIPLANVVQHNHWSGKNCPAELRAGKPYSWEAFLKRIAVEMELLPSVWALEAADWAVDNGIIQGDGVSYNWQSPVTREEMAVILQRYNRFKNMG